MFSFYSGKISCVRRRKERRRLHKTWCDIFSPFFISQAMIFSQARLFMLLLHFLLSWGKLGMVFLLIFHIIFLTPFKETEKEEKDQLNEFCLFLSFDNMLRFTLQKFLCWGIDKMIKKKASIRIFVAIGKWKFFYNWSNILNWVLRGFIKTFEILKLCVPKTWTHLTTYHVEFYLFEKLFN